jgi:hypothetical protein
MNGKRYVAVTLQQIFFVPKIACRQKCFFAVALGAN